MPCGAMSCQRAYAQVWEAAPSATRSCRGIENTVHAAGQILVGLAVDERALALLDRQARARRVGSAPRLGRGRTRHGARWSRSTRRGGRTSGLQKWSRFAFIGGQPRYLPSLATQMPCGMWNWLGPVPGSPQRANHQQCRHGVKRCTGRCHKIRDVRRRLGALARLGGRS